MTDLKACGNVGLSHLRCRTVRRVGRKNIFIRINQRLVYLFSIQVKSKKCCLVTYLIVTIAKFQLNFVISLTIKSCHIIGCNCIIHFPHKMKLSSVEITNMIRILCNVYSEQVQTLRMKDFISKSIFEIGAWTVYRPISLQYQKVTVMRTLIFSFIARHHKRGRREIFNTRIRGDL